MNRDVVRFWALTLCVVIIFSGCNPQQPFFFMDDGDLSHYVATATHIEYPDVEEPHLNEVNCSRPPLTLENVDTCEYWELTLEEVMRHALSNGEVLRSLGGRFVSNGSSRQAITGEAPDAVLTRPQLAETTYDPALVETGGTGARPGVEQALAEFDARFTTSVFWEKNDRPQNIPPLRLDPMDPTSPLIRTPRLNQDLGQFQSEISKVSASGGIFTVRNNTNYDSNNTRGTPVAGGGTTNRALYSDWTTNFEAEARFPLLQGAGAQYNRIAGPFSPFTGDGTQNFDGVLLARINTDIRLSQFQGRVRDFVFEVENAYWELYFAYRVLDAQKNGLEKSRRAWESANVRAKKGLARPADEAEARSQYFLFRSEVSIALTDIFRAESRLRYMMGISQSDCRLIRPADEPSAAKIDFCWEEVKCEALIRSPELREQKWRIKQRELELIAARNHLLPRLDLVSRYRWLGMGDDLISGNRSGLDHFESGSNAWESLTGGDFQESQLGLQMQFNLGFRRELATVRNQELALSRERAVLQEQELEIDHQLGDSVRNIVHHRVNAENNLSGLVAAINELEYREKLWETGAEGASLDLVLDAQRREVEAETRYHRSVVDHTRGIALLHLRKGSLLEYNSVHLTEGPWPKKAYFDALRLARQRDGSKFIDFAYTRPGPFSRGPVEQLGQQGAAAHEVLAGDAELVEPTPASSGESFGSEGVTLPENESYPTLAPPVEGPTPAPRPRNLPAPDDSAQTRGPVLESPRLARRPAPRPQRGPRSLEQWQGRGPAPNPIRRLSHEQPVKGGAREWTRANAPAPQRAAGWQAARQ